MDMSHLRKVAPPGGGAPPPSRAASGFGRGTLSSCCEEAAIVLVPRICVGLTPPKKTLTSDQIIISYVTIFLNNKKETANGWFGPKTNLWGGVNPTQIRSIYNLLF